ncbi:putative AlkP superfamily pyrophosphatase or phosphodiesterase [Sphingomonas insulae]|uniref:Ectonucleotide pyrophosphatase/phosphodiesterase n=1 Tax=Sphingomonas insulae TaxID=424800 RepID=A0ABN1HVV1_9SPHN|nr:alkaline phosphatase family protein [Sphingomonas insulae]NIJ28614.1 putative AlkP superfamily pyrophosphatase or phosphodiesterase [Sphingomonas insulae]
MRLIPLAVLAASLGACALPYTPPALSPVTQPAPQNAGATLPPAPMPRTNGAPVTILVSIDGFRPAYLQRGVTPNLNALAAGGVSASMRPSFPSVTFPNHWTLVTGKVPDHHGVVGNKMEDPARPGETFTMASDDPFWWNAAEPIWVTAEKAGVRTATMFWPGANVGWGGTIIPNSHGAIANATRPEDWQQFNQAVTGAQRVDAVIDWMRRPAAMRPRFVTLYFDTVDSAGHANGPQAPATTQAVADVDVQIGRLVQGLRDLDQPANLVIVADHGMAATDSARTIALDQVANAADYRPFEFGPYATLFPVTGHEAALEAALFKPHAHMTCWRKGAVPARFRYGTNPRIPPYVCLAEPGWLILKSAATDAFHGGAHGYDNRAPDMAALFIANGPAFVGGKRIVSFDNTDINPLLRDLIGLPAAPGLDGDDAPFRQVLKR